MTLRPLVSYQKVPMPYKPRAFIYGLIDPATREVRYVGQTSQGMKRPTDHSRPHVLALRPSHRSNWIKSLLAAGLRPEIEILEIVAAEDLNQAEEFWIGYLRFVGARLTNHTSGGDGVRGHRWSVEQKARVAGKQRGKIISAETRAKISAANTGRKHSPETRMRMAERHRGKTLSEEARAKISAKMTGRKRPPDVVARVAAAVKAALAARGPRRPKEKPPSGPDQRKGPCTEARRLAVSRAKGGRPFVDQNGVVYGTLAEATKATGVPRSLICKVLHGERKQSKGYTFRWKEEQLST